MAKRPFLYEKQAKNNRQLSHKVRRIAMKVRAVWFMIPNDRHRKKGRKKAAVGGGSRTAVVMSSFLLPYFVEVFQWLLPDT